MFSLFNAPKYGGLEVKILLHLYTFIGLRLAEASQVPYANVGKMVIEVTGRQKTKNKDTHVTI